MSFYNAPSMALLQPKVDQAFRGRVLSVFGMVGSVMMPVGMLIFGSLADIVAIEYLLIGTGIILTLLGIPFFTGRQLLEAGRP